MRVSFLFWNLNKRPLQAEVAKVAFAHDIRVLILADGEERPFFYDPMWRFFGERPDGPPGTHYYPAGGKTIAYHWNIYDQVLVRPALMDRLRDIKIVASIGKTSLLDGEGKPDRGVGSDHLPLVFTLEL